MPPIPRSSHATVISTNSFQHQKCPSASGAGELDDFRAKWWPSRAIIPSFCGWRKSSVVICLGVGKSLTTMFNYFLGKLLSTWTQLLCVVFCSSVIFPQFCTCFTSVSPYSYSFPLDTWLLQLINKGLSLSSEFTWWVRSLKAATVPHVLSTRVSHCRLKFLWKLINVPLYTQTQSQTRDSVMLAPHWRIIAQILAPIRSSRQSQGCS